ncbi:hypothetical protein EV421DRAFT_1917981 [Armillaria borealis]|uniref:Uncharacterized protein n=1 Tax=Armillaria borealis TaxID=47425 RepID=A0AA39IE87_9AGAR|nr:hypothetical protein EV421DRAFT_1917981 [Armillaria borealis]
MIVVTHRHIPTTLLFTTQSRSPTLEYRLLIPENDAVSNQEIMKNFKNGFKRFWATLRHKWGSGKRRPSTGNIPAGERLDANVLNIVNTDSATRDQYLLPDDVRNLTSTRNTADAVDVSASMYDDKNDSPVNKNLHIAGSSTQVYGSGSLECGRGLYTIWEDNEDVEEE